LFKQGETFFPSILRLSSRLRAESTPEVRRKRGWAKAEPLVVMNPPLKKDHSPHSLVDK
jgi:hypothetical protein